jgi:hypothetical protein
MDYLKGSAPSAMGLIGLMDKKERPVDHGTLFYGLAPRVLRGF